MAEFAFVLSVKQMQEWNIIEGHCERDGAKSEKMAIHKVNDAFNTSPNVDSDTTKARSVPETANQEKTDISVWIRKCAKLHGLPLTTKIDFAAFILFHCSYLIYNFVYWVPVLEDYYKTV